jgi:hypothetical protein
MKKSVLLLSVAALALAMPHKTTAQALHPTDYHSRIKSISTPNASALNKFEDIPVDLFTGTPGINVPLLNVVYNTVNVPVALSYNAGGIRVSEQPGVAGLGWSLVAGGQITRKVNGMQDEFNNIKFSEPHSDKGYFFNGSSLDNPNWNTSTMLTILNGYYNLDANNQGYPSYFDGEPDQFSFNFGQYSGSFYRSETGEWKVVSKQNLKLEISHELITGASNNYKLYNVESTDPMRYERIASHFSSFTIITPDGFEYTFGGDVSAIEFSRGQIMGTPTLENFPYPLAEHRANYITANTWMLSRIITPTNDTVKLNYKRGRPVFQKTKGYKTEFENGMYTFGPAEPTMSLTATNPVYLENIETRHQRIDFVTSQAIELKMLYPVYTYAHLDGMGPYDFKRSITGFWGDLSLYYGTGAGFDTIPRFNRQLDSINIFDKHKNAYTTGIKLFQSAVSTKRRTLDSVYHFSFTEDAGNKYKFYYSDVESLPGYESLRRDHYGLFNGGTEPAWESSNLPVRTPATAFALYGLINKIVYPTGGEARFEFEGGDYSSFVKFDPSNTSSPVSLVAENGNALVRIKKLIYKPNFGAPEIAKEYFYKKNYPTAGASGPSSGVLALRFNTSNGYPDIMNYHVTSGLCGGDYYLSNYSDDNSEWLGLLKGGYLTYSEVVEKSADGSFIIHKFSNSDQAAYRDEIHTSFGSADGSTSAGGAMFSVNITSNFRLSSNMLDRGDLLFKEFYNSNSVKVKDIAYQYNNDPSRKNNFIKALGFKKLYTSFECQGLKVKYIARGWAYKIYCYNNPLKKVTETSYESSGPIASSTSYAYDEYGNLTDKVSTTSDNKQIIESTKYNSHPDFLNTATSLEAQGIRKLFTDYKIKNYPVEQLTLVGPQPTSGGGSQLGAEQIIKGSIQTYDPTKPLPYKTYALELAAPFQPITYNLPSTQPVYHFDYARINNGNLVMDSRYKLQSTINSYTSYPLGTTRQPLGISTIADNLAYTWDYLAKHQTSATQNAQPFEVAYSSFEGSYLASGTDQNRGNWDFDKTRIIGTGFTGARCMELQAGDLITTVPTLANGKTYVVSFWAKGNQPRLQLGGSLVPAMYAPIREAAGWKFYRITVTGNGTALSVVRDITQPGNMQVDELRLHPQHAMMQSYTYDPAIGHMTSAADEAGKVTFMQYDTYGRLTHVKDESGNIIKQHTYQLQGPQ